MTRVIINESKPRRFRRRRHVHKWVPALYHQTVGYKGLIVETLVKVYCPDCNETRLVTSEDLKDE